MLKRNQLSQCGNKIKVAGLFDFMKSMKKNPTEDDERLTKEFYKTLCDELKTTLMAITH